MTMRYAILILLTTSLFGPIFGLCMAINGWAFSSPWGLRLLGMLTYGSLLALMMLCGAAREKHPQLVRGTLNFLGGLVAMGFLLALGMGIPTIQ